MKYTIVMSIKYSAAWLRKSRNERNAFNEKRLGPILMRYQDRVRMRFFDAEAFYADISDFIIFETDDLGDYYHLIEEIRDTELFQNEWMEVKDVRIGLEDGYKEYESSKGIV